MLWNQSSSSHQAPIIKLKMLNLAFGIFVYENITLSWARTLAGPFCIFQSAWHWASHVGGQAELNFHPFPTSFYTPRHLYLNFHQLFFFCRSHYASSFKLLSWVSTYYLLAISVSLLWILV
jgi:hypothetical protein